mgnify:CR=1 FL=1
MRNAAFMFSSRRGTKRLSNTWMGYSCLNGRWTDVAKGVLKDVLKRLYALEKEVLFLLGKAFWGVIPVDFGWQEEGSHKHTSSLERVEL